ncbi:MAG: hypothetical protein A2Y50_07310 [Pseudomonadales bacterium RIFCSPLOWO2_12_59_9]|nr:MAG: hypothetical protein A2Y50_07310 [Pseudomonadales bacterium RIFCSPLOWO2_12_59_9]
MDIIVIREKDLQSFRRPGLDLQSGRLVELAQPEEHEPVQLELPLEIISRRSRPSGVMVES